MTLVWLVDWIKAIDWVPAMGAHRQISPAPSARTLMSRWTNRTISTSSCAPSCRLACMFLLLVLLGGRVGECGLVHQIIFFVLQSRSFLFFLFFANERRCFASLICLLRVDVGDHVSDL